MANLYEQWLQSESGQQQAKLDRVNELVAARKKSGQSESKGNFLTSLIPTGGGVGGALAGGAAGAAIGSAVPVVGTAIGGLLGAILGGAGGSALGKFGENAVEGQQNLGQGVAQEALLGGLTSTPLGAVGKIARAGGALAKGSTAAAGQLVKEAGASAIPRAATDLQAKAAAEAGASGAASTAAPSLIQRAGTKLENTGNRLLGSQANLTRAEARRIGQLPSAVFGDINKRTGLTNIEDMAAVGSRVTGQGGAYSELVRNALGNTPGVDIGNLRSVGESLIADKAPLLTGQQRKSVLDQIQNSAVKA